MRRRLLTTASAVCLSVTLISPAGAMLAASAHGSKHHFVAPFAPAIVESFSTIHAAPNRPLTVTVRFVNANKPVRGAHLTGKLIVAKRALRTIKGGVTDARGAAHATFVVPQAAADKVLQVDVVLTYKGRAYHGRNDIRVGG